eukprot:11077595-Lingulodinium_polyedra.AAC.1
MAEHRAMRSAYPFGRRGEIAERPRRQLLPSPPTQGCARQFGIRRRTAPISSMPSRAMSACSWRGYRKFGYCARTSISMFAARPRPAVQCLPRFKLAPRPLTRGPCERGRSPCREPTDW